MSDRCFICGADNPNVLEEHHIVPRRYGGGNDAENLVTLCSNCHTTVEKLYDERFYHELGVEAEEPDYNGRTMLEYKAIVEQFIDECSFVTVGGTAPKDAVYEVFTDWAADAGFTAPPPKVQFGKVLNNLNGYNVESGQRRVNGAVENVYVGLGVDADLEQL